MTSTTIATTRSGCGSHSLTTPTIRKPISLMNIPLEQHASDVIAKAIKGKKTSYHNGEAAQRGGAEIFLPKNG